MFFMKKTRKPTLTERKDEVMTKARETMESEQIRTAGRSAGFLGLGALFGAIVALLFAPTSGKRLRREITHNATNLADDLKERARA